MKVTLDLVGLEGYLEELVKAGKDVDRVAEEGLEKGADVLTAGMIRRAPYQHIRSVIRKSGMGKDGNKHYVYVGVLRGTSAEDARIAAVWEFGGPGSNAGHGKRLHRAITAHPYIRPTLRQDAKKARTEIENLFQDWLKK
jgi:hypothetical protein